MELNPGEVWLAAPDVAVGREQAGRRPVVIVSGDEYHGLVTQLCLAVPVTSKGRDWPNHILLRMPGLGRPSWAMTEQVRVLSRDRLVRRLGMVDGEKLETIRSWVRDYLG